jgi:carotenoid cleavage dioxygenase
MNFTCTFAGELHFFRYTFEAAPYVSYGVLGPNGDLTSSLDIGAANIKHPIMMHDFAITQNWVVFLDNPLCFDAEVNVLACFTDCIVLYQH